MLGHLVEYARAHGLTAEPGFAPKAVRWALVHDPSGRFLEVVEQGDTEQKRNPGRLFPRCPELSQPEIKRGGPGCRHFLVDAADVVALFTDGPPDAKLQAKHAYFVRLLREASGFHPDLAPLAGIAAALEDPATLEAIGGSLRQQKAKPTDKVTFAISGEAGISFPVEEDSWHPWWRRFRRSLGEDEAPVDDGEPTTGTARCLASGELVTPTPTHPKIAGLSGVGGLAMGDVLASFKQEAFCSYGLEQAANAPVSEEMAAAYRAALNALLRDHSQKLAGSMVTHWFKERVAPENDPLPWLITPPEEQERSAQRRARELLEAIRTGKKADLGRNRYYILTLSGASGRVMVRDWDEGPFEELVESVEAWFSHLEIIRRDGSGLARSPKFLAVLGALVRDLKDVPAPLVTTLWRVALHHRQPIPRQVMAQALGLFRSDVLNADPINHARVGLLRAFHVRQGDTAMQPALNEEHANPAYHCGRLMAVLANLQQSALGDVGAGVVQRYYAAASATPALVLGRLVRTAQFHLNKMDSKGLAHWHEGRIASVLSRIGGTVPKTLSLEDQTAFALGYYHQIAADRAKPAAAANETVSANQETDDHD